MAVVKPAEPRIVDLLVASGVELSTWRLPAELYEPQFGPRINHDDLLDFHHLLEPTPGSTTSYGSIDSPTSDQCSDAEPAGRTPSSTRNAEPP